MCGWLNTHGYLTVRGNPWSVQVLTRYMDSGFPAGLLRVHDPKCACGHTNSCPNHIFIPGAHEELISPELWQQVPGRTREKEGATALRQTPVSAHQPCQVRSLPWYRPGRVRRA
ncbi:recombinase family protein [Streptomyces sp. ISL-94]|uniref:recombinase family protein n=1 Tax=Streptomyces sp. ISL-94 TaxID=2819190 RepID=UPI0035AE51F6